MRRWATIGLVVGAVIGGLWGAALAAAVSAVRKRPDQARIVERVLDRITYRIDGWRWTLERGQEKPAHYDGWGAGDPQYVRIWRDGKPHVRISAEAMGGTLIVVDRVWFPTSFPIVVVRAHTGNSHGQWTRFYAVRDGSLSLMGEVEGEVGGPVFRDMDGDGRQEWIFDDYSFMDFHLKERFFQVFTVRDGKLKLTRRIPNPTRKRLPELMLRKQRLWSEG